MEFGGSVCLLRVGKEGKGSKGVLMFEDTKSVQLLTLEMVEVDFN